MPPDSLSPAMTPSSSSDGVWTGATRRVAAVLTTTAALMALLVNAKNLGLGPWLGLAGATYADHAAARITVTPRADTLRALGDTSILAATVIDGRGSVLTGANLRWSSDDSTVALVDSGGVVVARHPGRAAITVMVRDLSARAEIVVAQRPARILLPGDTLVRIQQGDTVRLEAVAVDARGHRIAGVPLRWRTDDSTVVVLDSLGAARGVIPGRVTLLVQAGDVVGQVMAEVELTPAELRLGGGAGQRAQAGRPLAEPIVVEVRSRGGQPVPQAAVAFTTEDGDGAVEPAAAITDRQGRVRVLWTLGPRAGFQRLVARVTPIDSALFITAEADPVPRNVRMEVLTPEPGGPAGGPLDAPIAVRVTDTSGTALSAVRVSWATLDGGAVDGAPRTDSTGRVEGRWTLGPKAGRQRLLVQVGNPRMIPPTRIVATAQPGPASVMSLIRPFAQSGPAGKPLPGPITIIVRDSLGNALGGTTVTARPAQGTVKDSLLVTDASGRASARWTLGTAVGDQTLDLRLEGRDPALRVTVQAVAGAPAALTIEEQPGTRAPAPGQPRRLVVTVTDAFGNPVGEVPLAVAVRGGTVTPANGKSDRSGQARFSWTPGKTATESLITARISGTRLTANVTLPAKPARSTRKS